METKNMGGELISFKLNDRERIHQGEKCLNKKGMPYWNRHTPVLFPMVGKLKNNKALINGKSYEMGQHGFARDMEFESIEKTETKHVYELKNTKDTLNKYPFEFSLKISYEQVENKVKTTYEVKNIGEKLMPFGIGGHPAFCIEQKRLEEGDYFLEWEAEENEVEIYKLEEGLIKPEKEKNLLKANKILELDNHTFDQDAIIMKNLKSNKVALKSKRDGKTELEMDFTGFPYLGIWSKPGAPFICIEPWQSTADFSDFTGEFQEKQGIKIIQPGEIFQCSYQVIFY